METVKPCILVVDDELKYANAIAAILEASGYRVLVARDEESAVRLASSETPALVLLNMGMNRSGAYEICRRIRMVWGAPVIPLLTDATMDVSEEQMAEAGMEEYLPMPFSVDELLSRVRTTLTLSARGEPTQSSAEVLQTPYLRALLIEDSESDAALILHQLKKAGYTVASVRVDDAEQMQSAIKDRAWDIAIADHNMPHFDAREALSILRANELDIPFIVVSGAIDEETAIELMKSGAHDCLTKNNLERLGTVTRRELAEAQMRWERKRAKLELEKSYSLLKAALASTADGLLAVDNRGMVTHFNKKFMEMWNVSSRELLTSPSGDELLKICLQQLKKPDDLLSMARTFASDPRKETFGTLEFKDGRVLECYSSPQRVGQEIVGRVWNFHDITSRKHAEDALKRNVERLNALHSIDQAIISSADMESNLDVVLEYIQTQLNVDAVAALIHNEGTNELGFIAGRGFHTEALRHTHLSVNEGYAGRAARERKIVRIANLAAEDNALTQSLLVVGEGFVSYTGIPLIAKGQLRGVLEIFQRSPLNPTEDWSYYLYTLAGQAAIAIDNSLLWEDIRRSRAELMATYDATLEGWGRALDLRDEGTTGHTNRVADLAVQLAEFMGLSEEDLLHVRRGSLLHDIGKMGIPDSILLKPGALNEDEWEVMRRHPVYAHEWLSSIPYLRPALAIPYCHHEKWDGTGYPRGLKGEEIPLAARIFCVADVWDALTSDRPYRKAWPREKTIEYIRSQFGKHFDPKVAQSFLDYESWIGCARGRERSLSENDYRNMTMDSTPAVGRS